MKNLTTTCPHTLRAARILAGEVPVKLSTLERGSIFLVYIALECGIILDSQSLLRTPGAVMSHFYRLDRYGTGDKIGVWFRAVRADNNAPDGWAFVHTDTQMPFGCSPDIHVFIVEGSQKPPPLQVSKVTRNPPPPTAEQLTLPFCIKQ